MPVALSAPPTTVLDPSYLMTVFDDQSELSDVSIRKKTAIRDWENFFDQREAAIASGASISLSDFLGKMERRFGHEF